MRTRGKGFTLIEIVVVSVLFSLVLLLIFRALDSIVPAQRKLSGQVERLREGATTIARMQRELRTSAFVHWPAGNWTTYTPDLQPSNGPLMFVKNRPPDGWLSGDVIAYWLDPVNKTVKRTAYEGTGFVFGAAGTYAPLPDEVLGGRILAREVEDLQLKSELVDGVTYMGIELTMEGVAEPITARIRRLPAPGL